MRSFLFWNTTHTTELAAYSAVSLLGSTSGLCQTSPDRGRVRRRRRRRVRHSRRRPHDVVRFLSAVYRISAAMRSRLQNRAAAKCSKFEFVFFSVENEFVYWISRCGLEYSCNRSVNSERGTAQPRIRIVRIPCERQRDDLLRSIMLNKFKFKQILRHSVSRSHFANISHIHTLASSDSIEKVFFLLNHR